MDEDLAFCLGQFIDEQLQLMDDRIDKIKNEEKKECRQIEEAKRDFDRKKPPPKDNGSHPRDKALVDRFIRDLRDNSNGSETKTILDDPTCLSTLRAEIETKVGACANYVTRLKNLASPQPRTTNFVQSCNETINYCRRPQVLEENFQNLCTVLTKSDETNLVQNIGKWWKETYGAKITDLNRRSQKISPGMSENNFAIISPTNRIMKNGENLLKARVVVVVEAPRVEIIREFVRQLLSLDKEHPHKADPDTLVEQLNTDDIDKAIAYADKWLKNRDEIRNHKDPDPYGDKLAEAKAEYGRQRIAQEAKKLALAALLCRLAVGSVNDARFDEKLKKTVHKQNKNNDEGLAVISGDVKQPEVDQLPMIIQLQINGSNMNQWKENENNIRERFGAGLCRAFGIPDKNIRIERVEVGQGIVHLYVLPPYGKNVIDSLNGNAVDAAARMAAVRKCCIDLNAKIESITLGDFGLNVEARLMDPKWNRKYVGPGDSREGVHYWQTPIDQGGKPYHCPSGWMRFGVKVAEDEKEFDAKWSSWHIAYHGTRGEHATSILTSGLRVSTTGCFYEEGTPRVYVSPSIEYSAHPRYAFPWQKTKKNGQNIWYQLIFQCRVNPASIDNIGPETLLKDESKTTILVDPNFTNGELEWIILGKKGIQYINDDIICYGLMMRASSIDPDKLSASAWWPHAHFIVDYKKKNP